MAIKDADDIPILPQGNTMHRPRRSRSPLALLGLGLILAATGVGAGDLTTAGFAGSKSGPSVAWAVAIGGERVRGLSGESACRSKPRTAHRDQFLK